MSDPTQKYSITMPSGVAEAARARSGSSGLSAYVTAAVARQIERDNLNDLIAVAEAEHGPITDEEVQAARDALLAAREQQGTSDPDPSGQGAA
ncbi:MAG: CopG family transcriptional regulator [Frankia sp.]